MGEEDETIDFESLKQTMVFWNIDDYPTPSDDDLDPIFCDILKALHVMGFRYGYIKVILYSQHPNIDKQEMHLLTRGKFYKVFVFNMPDITMHLIRHASIYGPGPVNFFVIAKPQRELHRVLQCLKSRRHNVVLLKPPQHEEDFVFSLDSLLENARLLGGGKPRFKELYPYYSLEYDMSEEKHVEVKEADVSITVDFSERIPTVKGVRTAVFWDAEDCPFPLGSTPDDIYHSIVSALVQRYYDDNITIWVYLDDHKKGSWRDVLLRGPKTWASRIYFLPGGDKAERRVRMLNDIYLWKRDSPQLIRRYEASVVLVSDQFKDFAYYTEWLQRLYEMHYDLLLVTPTLHINKPESPLWPGLLIGKGGYLYGFENSTQISQHPCPPKIHQEAHAAANIKKPESPEWPSGPFSDETSESSEDAEAEEMLDSLLLEPVALDLNKPENPVWPGWQIDGGTGLESFAEPFPKEHKAEVAKEETHEKLAMYRWDPITVMYKSERPGWQIDGVTGWESSQEPSPKRHKADAADKEKPEKLAMYRLEPITLLQPKNKWQGRQIDGGPGCESSEEPCPKEHNEYGNRKLVMSVLTRYDALRRRFCQLMITTPAYSKAGSICMSRGVITNTMKGVGVVPGVEIGDIFFFKFEMELVGLHSSLAGIDYLAVKGETTIATSILSSGYSDNDEGKPDVLVYTGQGGGNADKENQTSDQKDRGNLALEKSLVRNSPVRVIRGLKDASQGVKIYVYDGLYEVKESWVEKGKSGHNNTFKYKLVRAPCQTPAFATWIAIKKWKAGLPASREGLILADLTCGVESIGVSLVNNVDDENGPAYFTYSKTVTYSEPFKLTQASLGCDCSRSCKPGNLNCYCIRKNGGDYPYCVSRVLVCRRPMIYECSPSCSCSVCKNKVTQMGIKLRLEVFKTINRGWGLRSWDPIRAGSFICIYAGEAKEKKSNVEEQTDDYAFDTTRVYTDFKWNYEHGLADEVDSEEVSEEPELPLPLVISGKNVGNVARFMNHSCSPNVFWQPVSYENNGQLFLHVAFFAISHIPPMTELTYDYGVTRPSEALNDNTLYGKNKCFCGSEYCNGSFG